MSGYDQPNSGNYPPPPPPPPGGGPNYGGSFNPMAGGGSHPIQVLVEHPERQSRLLAALSIPFFLARYILLIPAVFCLYFVMIVAAFAAWFGTIATAFTGHYPDGMFRFVVGTLRWSTRVSAYLYGVTDKYPPFSFQE